MNSDHDTLLRGWVAPFGDPGITDRSHLPRAFRSVPRPSSPLSAKASTRCPCLSLDPRCPFGAPRAGQTQPAQTRSRHPGKPPRTGASPKPRRLHVKTLFRTAPHPGITPGASGPSASVTFTNSLYPSINTRPRPGAAGGRVSARPPRTRERCLVFAECRSQGSGARGQNTKSEHQDRIGRLISVVGRLTRWR